MVGRNKQDGKKAIERGLAEANMGEPIPNEKIMKQVKAIYNLDRGR